MYINIDCSVQDLTQNFDNKWKVVVKKSEQFHRRLKSTCTRIVIFQFL